MLDTGFAKYCKDEMIDYSIERDKQYENFGETVLFDIFWAIIKILDR